MDYFLGQSGVTRLASDLKTKFQALFAAISHTHNAATDLIGQVPIANGGTGASTQADAQVALDIAPKDSAAHTVGEIETMVSGLTSKTGVDGMTVGENDLHTQIQTLQDSVTKSQVLRFRTDKLSTSSFDAYTENGIWYMGSSATYTNAPFPEPCYPYLFTIHHVSGDVIQMAFNVVSGKAKIRTRNNGSWKAWLDMS